MGSMVGRPPKRTSLSRRRAQEDQDELRRSGGFECPVRKITVIGSGDGKHPDQIKPDGAAHRGPAPADQKHCKATDVKNHKRCAAKPVYTVDVANLAPAARGMKVGVKPLDKSSDQGGNDLGSH